LGRAAARAILGPALAFAALFALLVLAVEAGSFLTLRLLAARARARPLAAREMPAYRRYPWAETFWREQKRQLSLEYHPFGLWRSRPFSGETINVDASGLRRTVHSRCGPGDRLVWLFGGSTMWGFGAPDWETIPSLLAKRYADERRPVCAVNYGEDSWRAAQGVVKLTLELKTASRRPDVVVFLSGCNDVFTPFFLTGRADREWDFAESKPWLDDLATRGDGSFAFLRATNTAMLARRVATRLKGPAPWPAPSDPGRLAQEVADDFFHDMEVVDALSRGYGFRYAFFWQPLGVTDGKVLTAEEQEGIRRQLGFSYDAGRVAAAATLALIRGRPRPNVYSIADVFEGHAGSVYVDSCHLLPEGNALIADRIYEGLEAGAR
jgi:lysophospholipase L1-like esterase